MVDWARLNPLVAGSHEKVIEQTQHSVNEWCAQNQVDKGKVVGTFHDRAIFLTGDGRTFRAVLKEGKIEEAQELKGLTALDKREVNEMAQKTLAEAVKLLFLGRVADAKDKVKEVAEYSDHVDAAPFLSEEVGKLIARETEWKRFLKDNKVAIKRKLHEEVAKNEFSVGFSKNEDLDKIVAHIEESRGILKNWKSDSTVRESALDECEQILEATKAAMNRTDDQKVLGDLYGRLRDYANHIRLTSLYLSTSNG